MISSGEELQKIETYLKEIFGDDNYKKLRSFDRFFNTLIGKFQESNTELTKLDAYVKRSEENSNVLLAEHSESIRIINQITRSLQLEEMPQITAQLTDVKKQLRLLQQIPQTAPAQQQAPIEIAALKNISPQLGVLQEELGQLRTDNKKLQSEIYRLNTEYTKSQQTIAALTTTISRLVTRVELLEGTAAKTDAPTSLPVTSIKNTAVNVQASFTNRAAADSTTAVQTMEERYHAQVRNYENDRIVQQFNVWARSLLGRIPSGFVYLAGDIQVREPQILHETKEETKWIISDNTEGKKYLFPNPHSFDTYTNIPNFYKMDQRQLREKGKNRIEIIKPCEIEANGFIEFPGELKLLP